MGRPLGFDRDRALDRAMKVFWKNGFEAASISDLTDAMQIQAPSLYAAFGNKEKLFAEILERYLSGPAAFMSEALKEPSAYVAVGRIPRECADFLTRRPRCGCLTIQAALTGGEGSTTVRRKLLGVRLKGQEQLRLRLELAKAEAELPQSADTADLARFYTTVFQGMTVQAISGATREELVRIAGMAMAIWPGKRDQSNPAQM